MKEGVPGRETSDGTAMEGEGKKDRRKRVGWDETGHPSRLRAPERAGRVAFLVLGLGKKWRWGV